MKELYWPTLEEIENNDNKYSLLALAYMMWGNCHLEKPPEYFGEAMVLIGQKLGITPIKSEMDKLYKELVQK